MKGKRKCLFFSFENHMGINEWIYLEKDWVKIGKRMNEKEIKLFQSQSKIIVSLTSDCVH